MKMEKWFGLYTCMSETRYIYGSLAGVEIDLILLPTITL